jgi:pilus assembly protein Flp/PilA
LLTTIYIHEITPYFFNRINVLARPRWYSQAWFEAAGANPVLWTRSDSHVWIIKELPMKNLFVRFVKNESGATAIEYGLIAAGISVAIIAVVNGLGTNLTATFQKVSTALQ